MFGVFYCGFGFEYERMLKAAQWAEELKRRHAAGIKANKTAPRFIRSVPTRSRPRTCSARG